MLLKHNACRQKNVNTTKILNTNDCFYEKSQITYSQTAENSGFLESRLVAWCHELNILTKIVHDFWCAEK